VRPHLAQQRRGADRAHAVRVEVEHQQLEVVRAGEQGHGLGHVRGVHHACHGLVAAQHRAQRDHGQGLVGDQKDVHSVAPLDVCNVVV